MKTVHSRKKIIRTSFVFVLLSLLILSSTSVPVVSVKAASNASLPENWLERFNYFRQAAGLPPVIESTTYSTDLAKHVNYMLLNVPTEGLWHGETPGRPGYTAEGAQAAAESNLWFGGGFHATPADAMDGWMNSIHHRYGILRPDLATTGFGFGCDTKNCGAGLNVIRGIVWDSSLRPNGVVYPGQNQINVNRDIILSWQFLSDSTVVLKNASLRNSAGQLILISTTSPSAGDYFNMISVDPTSLLAHGTTYTADITVQLGAAQLSQTWSFTTAFDPNALPYVISGNAGVSGATISYTGGSTLTDGSGNYLIPIPSGWSGTVTPSHPCYAFSPVNGTYTSVTTDQMSQDYAPTFNNAPVCAVTVGVFRPTNGALYLKNSNTTGFADVQINYGLGGDYPIVGDWDGNGTATIGIYRNGSFYLRNSNTIGFADIVFPFGMPGDQPIAGDWDADGVDTIGVYRRGAFYLRNDNSSGDPGASFSLGLPGDVGIAGDWDGDGADTTGVFRPSNGALYLKNTNVTGFADTQINYGIPGDKPVTGDWNNDGTDTIGIYRNGGFYLRNSNTIGFADIVFALGIPGDMPIAGNWDGQP